MLNEPSADLNSHLGFSSLPLEEALCSSVWSAANSWWFAEGPDNPSWLLNMHCTIACRFDFTHGINNMPSKMPSSQCGTKATQLSSSLWYWVCWEDGSHTGTCIDSSDWLTVCHGRNDMQPPESTVSAVSIIEKSDGPTWEGHWRRVCYISDCKT